MSFSFFPSISLNISSLKPNKTPRESGCGKNAERNLQAGIGPRKEDWTPALIIA